MKPTWKKIYHPNGQTMVCPTGRRPHYVTWFEPSSLRVHPEISKLFDPPSNPHDSKHKRALS